MPAACAVEMIHAYSLVHDDLPAMDDDDLASRTAHMPQGLRRGERDSGGRRFASDGIRDACPRRKACRRRPPLASRPWPMRPEPARWWAGRPTIWPASPSAPTARTRSTGRLGIDPPAERPERCFVSRCGWAGWWPAPIRRGRRPWRRTAKSSGLAFQIVDDLLDVEGEEAAVGKRLGKDSSRGKMTFPGLLGIDESRRYARQMIDDAVAGARAIGSGRSAAGRLGTIRPGKESMMDDLLMTIQSPARFATACRCAQLKQLAAEMREALRKVVARSHGPFRFEPGRGRAVPGTAHDVRFPPRPPDLGHRPSNLSAQADHRPLSAVRHDSHRAAA